jgi:hypothetical protein
LKDDVMKHFAALASLALLAACATADVSAPPPPPSGGAAIPSTPLELGDWRTATAPATLAAFERNVQSRYGAGLAINAVTGDLRAQDFNCAEGVRSADGRGSPPAQVCRRTVTANNCTHTWQVHLFGTAGRLAQTRGLYDRRCGGDGLLGGAG